MHNFFRKKPQGSKVVFKINGMHCTSCSMNIDGELGDTEGVISASTSYARARSTIEYDPSKVSKEKLQNIIKQLDYEVEEVES